MTVKNTNQKAAFLGKITASVTHDLQNVLAIVKETSGLMEDYFLMHRSGGLENFEDKIETCIKTIKQQTYRGVDLTSGLNGFAHTADSKKDSINIFEVLKRMLFITQRLFKQKGVDVSIIDSDTTCSILTDPLLFQELIFSCIECLIDFFETTSHITLDIRSSGNLRVIKVSCRGDLIQQRADIHKISQSDPWTKINELCNRINATAKAEAHTTSILISL